jgi:hypothetical protein
MPYEPLERLLTTVTDDELESLRDAILREEGRRRSQYQLEVTAPFPPLIPDEARAKTITRWARLLGWLASEQNVPSAEGQRGIAIQLVYASEPPPADEAGILLQEALVEAGLLLGRTPEWMAATQTQIEQGATDRVCIEMWPKPVETSHWD